MEHIEIIDQVDALNEEIHDIAIIFGIINDFFARCNMIDEKNTRSILSDYSYCAPFSRVISKRLDEISEKMSKLALSLS